MRTYRRPADALLNLVEELELLRRVLDLTFKQLTPNDTCNSRVLTHLLIVVGPVGFEQLCIHMSQNMRYQ